MKELQKINEIYRGMLQIHLSKARLNLLENNLEFIIFSKDRALQLHALLSSYYEQVKDPAPLHLVYTASTERHQKSYNDIFKLFPNKFKSIIKEKKFREDLINLIDGIDIPNIVFLVDDIVFIRPLVLKDFSKFPTERFVSSLRLSGNIDFSYTLNQGQPRPNFIPGIVNDEDKLCWKWEDGIMDWNYPLSLDGHMFSREEFLLLVKNIDFHNPNTLEVALQKFSTLFTFRYAVCYKESIILNLPINRVQNEFDNIFGNLHQDKLLTLWENGNQIDYRSIYKFSNRSVHQEVPVQFISR